MGLNYTTHQLLSLLAEVKWKHSSGKVADAVRAWQADGCPDLPRVEMPKPPWTVEIWKPRTEEE